MSHGRSQITDGSEYPGLDSTDAVISVSQFLEAIDDSCDLIQQDQDEGIDLEKIIDIMKLAVLVLGIRGQGLQDVGSIIERLRNLG